MFTRNEDRSLFPITPKIEAWGWEWKGEMGPLNVGADKAGEGRAGAPEHPHLPLSQVGRSRVPQGVWGPEGGPLWGEGVLAAYLWGAGSCRAAELGAGGLSLGENLFCSPLCRAGEAQAQPFLPFKKKTPAKPWKKSSLRRRLFIFLYFICFRGNQAAILQIPISLFPPQDSLSLLRFIAPIWVQTFEPGRAPQRYQWGCQ